MILLISERLQYLQLRMFNVQHVYFRFKKLILKVNVYQECFKILATI